MKNAIKFSTLLGIATVAFTMPALSDYKFSVKVKNNTDHMLTNVTAYWKAKGSNNQNMCWPGGLAIQEKESIQRRCGTTANTKKWQRQIKVSFNCPNYLMSASNPAGKREKHFPASDKYFERDHAVNKNDIYTVTIKNSDCFISPS
jgi:hypothetical protein|tara:strand:- start:264 stop:701 length:438 start_codon:yes stop_codon:yes gene_type:complete